jgi:hypothetical protein
MQAAASMDRSEYFFGMGIAFPSGALPVETETNPPAAMIRSNALRSTTRSRTTGNALRAPGFKVENITVLKVTHMELANCRAGLRAVRNAVDHEATHSADPFATVVIESNGFLALRSEIFIEDVEHLQE